MNETSYRSAHSALAFFDASKRFGRVAAKGPDAIDLLHRMSTNDLLPLIGKEGSGAQTVLTTEKGRIIDLLQVLSLGNEALLVTSGGYEEEVIAWLDKYVIMEDAKYENVSKDISQFLIFGPQSLSFLQELSRENLIALEQFHFITTNIADVEVRLQKTHRIIESGFTIFCNFNDEAKVKEHFVSAITSHGGAEIDDDTFEALRIEAGIPLAPNELNGKHNPLETTLVQAISWTKGCYIGQEVIARLDTYDKVQRHMMGIELQNGKDQTPLAILSSDGAEIGEITSIAFSPSMNKNIGLAFVKTAFANPGAEVMAGGIGAKLVKLPFDI